MGPRLKELSTGVKYEPKINGSIGRINRDVRFSRDKRPYKDHLDIWFWHGEKKGWDRPGFYLRVTPKTIYLGSGMHMLEGEMLERFRKAVVADGPGKQACRRRCQGEEGRSLRGRRRDAQDRAARLRCQPRARRPAAA